MILSKWVDQKWKFYLLPGLAAQDTLEMAVLSYISTVDPSSVPVSKIIKCTEHSSDNDAPLVSFKSRSSAIAPQKEMVTATTVASSDDDTIPRTTPKPSWLPLC